MNQYDRLSRKLQKECNYSEQVTSRLFSKSFEDVVKKLSNKEAETAEELQDMTSGVKKTTKKNQ